VAFAADASESRALFLTREAAERVARKYGWFVAELFAKPTLTDAERQALEWAEDASNAKRAAAIRGLLERIG
jgi:hypothetical protein